MRTLFLIIILLLIVVNLAFAEMPVYCHLCKQHLYNYQRDEFVKGEWPDAKDFMPAVEGVKQPVDSDPMVCPFDQAPLNGYEFIFWVKGLRPPVFKYKATSFLTFRDGGFIELPFETPVLED